MRRQLAGFLLVGIARTLLGYLLYLALLLVFSYWAAFTICYAITLVFSLFVNGNYVFRTHVSLRLAFRYGVVYCANYLMGLMVLAFAIEVMGSGEVIAPLLVIAVMFPVNFLTERYALTR